MGSLNKQKRQEAAADLEQLWTNKSSVFTPPTHYFLVNQLLVADKRLIIPILMLRESLTLGNSLCVLVTWERSYVPTT